MPALSAERELHDRASRAELIRAYATAARSRPLAAKCQLDLACILATTGDAVEARRFLNSALDLFGEMGLVADAPKVEQVQKILALRAPIA